MEKFNITLFKENQKNRLIEESKKFENYRDLNPNLTEKMFNHLLYNGGLWRISCGLRVEIPWENEILEEVYWLKHAVYGND